MNKLMNIFFPQVDRLKKLSEKYTAIRSNIKRQEESLKKWESINNTK